jgi:RNA polymerase sigma factor (sigma-70 family)
MNLDERMYEQEDTIKNLVKYNKIKGYDAEDLAQDLRLVLIHCHNTFDESKNVKFKTYFSKSALNYIYKQQRKINNYYANQVDISTMTEDNNFETALDLFYQPEQFSPFEDMLPEILNIINDLPQGKFTLDYYFGGLTQQELAEKNGISQVMVHKILQNNTEHLKKIFNPSGYKSKNSRL